MQTCKMFVCKDIETIEYLKKEPTFLKKKIRTLRLNHSRILWIMDAKFSGYYFDINRYRDFQICISLPLTPCTS